MLSLVLGGFVLVTTFVIVLAAASPTKSEKKLQKRIGRVVVDAFSNASDEVEASILQARRKRQFLVIERLFDRYFFYKHVERVIEQSDVDTTASFVLGLSSAAFMSVLGVAYVLLLTWPLAAIAGVVVSALPYIYLRIRRRARLNAFHKGLGDAISILSRSLQAGLSISAALEVLSDQAPAPVCDEFDIVRQQILVGGDYRTCLKDMVDRVPSQDLHFVITSLLIQRETGGNLIEVLTKAEDLLRDRMKLKGDLDAKTAQGRLTGLILFLLPFILAGLMLSISPSYLTPLFKTSLGHKAIYGALAMECLGGAIIYRLTQIQI